MKFQQTMRGEVFFRVVKMAWTSPATSDNFFCSSHKVLQTGGHREFSQLAAITQFSFSRFFQGVTALPT